MEPLNPEEVIRTWVADLRSGKFKQGRARLRRKNADGFAYCCLGVLGEQLVAAGRCKWNTMAGEDYLHSADKPPSIGLVSWLPMDVIQEFGLDKVVSMGNHTGRMAAKLVEMNDDESADFFTIADFIEDQLPAGLEG